MINIQDPSPSLNEILTVTVLRFARLPIIQHAAKIAPASEFTRSDFKLVMIGLTYEQNNSRVFES